MRKQALLYLNGKRYEIAAEQAGMMLADYLRHVRHLTGTKIVCAEGDCGACTVLRLFPDGARGPAKNVYLPINSCITTVAQLDGSSLVTVDSLADKSLTPVQQAMMNCHGSQCGFCTPGFVMALTGLVEKKLCNQKTASAPIAPKEAQNATTGNLCRCTGYQPIIEAAVSVDVSRCAPVRARFFSKAQESDLKKAHKQALLLEAENISFFAPTSLKAARQYLAKYRDARLVGAATDLGVVHNKRKIRLHRMVSLHLIPSLYELKESKGRLLVGARVTLSELRYAVKKKAPEFARFLDLFASPQIKNIATLVGNVSNASPIADTPPFLLAMDARVHILGARGKRIVEISDFFLGYRKTALKPGEIIYAIDFCLPEKQESLSLYKASQRKDLDISAANAAFRIFWTDAKKSSVKDIRLAMGGVAATTIRLSNAEAVFRGQKITKPLLGRAIEALQADIKPMSDLRGSAAFRRLLAENFLRRFVLENVGTLDS